MISFAMNVIGPMGDRTKRGAWVVDLLRSHPPLLALVRLVYPTNAYKSITKL